MKKNLYLITPCSRIKNLPKIKRSIDFNIIKKWIIVYDIIATKSQKKLFSKTKGINEFFLKDKLSVSGNAQRNFALDYFGEHDQPLTLISGTYPLFFQGSFLCVQRERQIQIGIDP